MAVKPVFVFGTMLDEDVRRVVFDVVLPATTIEPAEMADVQRLRLPDESYPILVDAPGASVSGLLLHELDEPLLARLSFFESDEYDLADCTVIAAAGRVDASYYAAAEVMAGASEPWVLETWQREHKSRYLSDITRFMALYGKAGRAEAEALWAEEDKD